MQVKRPILLPGQHLYIGSSCFILLYIIIIGQDIMYYDVEIICLIAFDSEKSVILNP